MKTTMKNTQPETQIKNEQYWTPEGIISGEPSR
jgi:hypothetical protein